MTENQIEQVLGPPTKSDRSYLVFESSQKKRMTREQARRFAALGSDETSYTIQRTIRALLSDGKVIGILAWQGSST